MVGLARLVAMAAGAVLLAGCGQSAFLSWGGSGGARGSIDGSVIRGPGVDPRSGGGATHPVPGDPIVARQVDGSARAVAISSQDGSFHMSLPVGVYRVTEGICGVTEQVNVQGDSAVSVGLKLPRSC